MAGQPATDPELIVAYWAIFLIHTHQDNPAFGYRFLPAKTSDASTLIAERTAWQICSSDDWFRRFGKKLQRGNDTNTEPPVPDDPVQRDFTATAANKLWLVEITKHEAL